MGSENEVLPTVIVTGFGPFRNIKENSSWVTVQELLKLDIRDYRIIAKELPVEYETVSNVVPHLWKEHNPKLVVHCGMSEKATCLTVEQLANNRCYVGPDVSGQLPSDNVCCTDGPDVLYTHIDIGKVVQAVNDASVPVTAIASEDAGRYLCEFIYYTSLKISKKTVFVHVPPINQPYTAKELAEGMAILIRSMLEQCTSCLS